MLSAAKLSLDWCLFESPGVPKGEIHVNNLAFPILCNRLIYNPSDVYSHVSNKLETKNTSQFEKYMEGILK